MIQMDTRFAIIHMILLKSFSYLICCNSVYILYKKGTMKDVFLDDEFFMLWALGEDYKIIKSHQVPEYWNKLHGDKLTLSLTGNRKKDIEKMRKLYEEEIKTIPKVNND